MTTFDPFTNERTSQVFCQILNGNTTPKKISDVLGIQPSTVVKHFRKLQRIKIIKLGKKEGKFQNYEIDFGVFLPLFIERAFQEKMTHPKDLYPEEYQELKALSKEKFFKNLIVRYLQNQGMSATLAESARSVEDALKLLKFNRKLDSLEDEDKTELFNKLLHWKKIAEKKKTFAELNFIDAFSNIFYKHKS